MGFGGLFFFPRLRQNGIWSRLVSKASFQGRAAAVLELTDSKTSPLLGDTNRSERLSTENNNQANLEGRDVRGKGH